MSTLQFPSNPVNGELYPPNPPRGDVQYQYDATANTWRLIGAASGVIPGTYGSLDNIPQFTVDSTGRLTFAQNLPISGLVGTLQTVTDNGNTTTNPIFIDIEGASGLGFAVVNASALPDRVEIHPTFVGVRNGYIQVEENSTPSIEINALGTPRIQILRGGYLSMGTGTSVFTEKLRLVGQDGSARFDGSVVVRDLSSNGDIQVFEQGTLVAKVADTGSFFNTLEIGGLNYPTADAPPGYIMTTDGLGNLSLQPAPSVTASTLQAVTDAGSTTTNKMSFLDSVGSTVVSIDPVNANISILPQAVGEPGTIISSTDITFGGSTASILATGTNPASLNFAGTSGVSIVSNLGTIPISLRPGGTNIVSVTSTSTVINNALIASGLSYPTSDGTNGQVISTDGNGNLAWSTVVTTLGDLQNVTNSGNTTTNSIIIDGSINPDYPLIITSGATEQAVQIKGNLAEGKSYLGFFDNTGVTPYGFLESGPTYLGIGAGTSPFSIKVESDKTTVSAPVTMTSGLDISGNISGIYQLRTSGLGGISITNGTVETANIQGATGNITTQGKLIASGLSYPTTDGAAGQVLSTDGNGNIGWGSLSVGSLQTVTDNGNTTTNSITVAGITSNGSTNLLAPVNAESVQIGTLTDILNLNSGFANVADTVNFGSDMVICNLSDPILGPSNRIIVGNSNLIIGTQGGTGASTYYSELIVVDTGDDSTFPNTSSVSLGYGDGTQKLSTTATGVTVTGQVVSDSLDVSGVANFQNDVVIAPYDSIAGSNQILLGTDEFQIYNDGVSTYFTNSATNTAGELFLRSTQVTLSNFDSSKTMATFSEASDSIFYYNNIETFRINGLGVGVTGRAVISGALTASGLAYPIADGTSGQFLTTNGAGTLGWSSGSVGDLQQVTSNGSTTTNNIEIDGGHLRVETTLNPSLGYAFVGSDVIKVSNGSILALVNDTSGVAITGTGIATSSGVGISVSLVSPGVYRATIDGTTGNISTAGSVSSASVSVTNDTSTGNLAVGETAPASGVYNINMTGASGNINTVGAISSGSLSTTGNISGTALTLTGDISAANICSTGFVSANSLTATAGITGQALTLNGPNANTNFTMQGNACIVGGALNGGCLAMDRDLTVGGAITASGVISNGASSMCSGRVEAANILTTAGTLRSTGSTQLYDNIAFICSATGDKYFYEGFTSSPGQFLQASAPDINGDVRMEWADSVTVVPVPNSSTDPGNLGEVAIGNFFYWYTGTQWVRVAGNSYKKSRDKSSGSSFAKLP